MTVTTFSNFLLIAYPNNIVSTVTFTTVTFTLAMRSYFLFKRSLD